MKIFWSWQSDTPGKIGRHLVRDALNAAIEQLKQAPDIEEPVEGEARSTMHLDHDRKGISGNPDLTPVIFTKIEQSNVFVADVTTIGTVFDNAGRVEPAKKLINSNVAIELGYALHALTDRSLLMVMNTYYGSRADLPFDLQSKAGSILFNLSPSADKQAITSAAKQLTGQFIEALKPFIEQRVENIRQARPFPPAEPMDGPARFRAPGHDLGIRDGVGFIDSGAGSSISFASGPAVLLRVMPSMNPGKKWTIVELRKALHQGINLPTLIGPANGLYTFRAEDGVGTCIILQPNEHQTDHATFAFNSGEIWAISTFPLRTNSDELWVGEIEKMLCEQLPRYAEFLRSLGIQPPYKWKAGLTEVRGRELQYPVAPGRMRVPRLASHKCVSDNIISEGMFDAVQSSTNALSPFFVEIYDKCGMSRPDHLPR